MIIILLCSILNHPFNRNKNENFIDTICSDYYTSKNYPSLDLNGQSVINDLETVSYLPNNNSNLNNYFPGQQVDACVIPKELLGRYKLDENCLLKDQDNNLPNTYQLTPLSKNNILSGDGCMLRFSDFDNSGQPFYNPNDAVKFPDLLKIAYSNKDYDNRIAIQNAQKILNNQLNDRNNQQSILNNTKSGLNVSEKLNNQLIGSNTILSRNKDLTVRRLNDLNSNLSVSTDLSNKLVSGLFIEQNTQIYNVETNPPKISKTFIINGKGYKYDVLWKYNSKNAINRNTDPHILWSGGYPSYVNENINCSDKDLIFDSTNNYSYRNGDLINSIFSSNNQYYFLIEVYNKKGDNPICWLKFSVDTLRNNISNWFNNNNLIETNITGLLTQKNNCNIFSSTAGHDDWKRRFFINLAYQGCDKDPGFFGIPFSNICNWDNKYHGYIITTKSGPRYFGANDQANSSYYDIGSSMIIYSLKR